MTETTNERKQPKKKKSVRRRAPARKAESRGTEIAQSESAAPVTAVAQQVELADVKVTTTGPTTTVADEAPASAPSGGRRRKRRSKKATRTDEVVTPSGSSETTAETTPPAPVEVKTVAKTDGDAPASRSSRRRRGSRGRGGAAAKGAARTGEPKVDSNEGDGSDTPAQRESPEPAGEQRRPRPRRKSGRAGRSADSVSRPEVSASIDAKRTATAQADKEAEGTTEATHQTTRQASESTTTADRGTRILLINTSAGDECRIAVLHQNRLEELFIERTATQSHVGSIYKGRICNVEPSIQAVFVEFGLPQNGFLHISDVQPQYFPDPTSGSEEVGRKIPRHQRPPIQECFRRGDEVIVQVTKEGVGTKGPTLTTYLSIPGRFLVMMPGMSRHGVSRKIEDEADRRTMRDLLAELDLPSDMGFILRTAGLGRTKRELQRDLQYLMRLWRNVADRIKKSRTPAALYQETDLVARTLRDVVTTDFRRIIVDDAATVPQVNEFLRIAMPRSKVAVELYDDREPMFHRYGIEDEIERIHSRHVPLASGGSLVIDSTEALVAIDVNSGRARLNDDAEDAAFRLNMEAAEEIARQLRLRDLGGLIVCDFVDMRAARHNRDVERAMREALKRHKEAAKILPISKYGLMQMTRQRRGPSITQNIFDDCPHCKGSGVVKMAESVVLDVMRVIQVATNRQNVQKVIVTVASEVAYRILNLKRTALGEIESATKKQVVIHGDASFTSDQVEYVCEDSRGRVVDTVGAQRHRRRN